ncbi:MAG: aminomethyl-transferring glycine dehydrogenase subunit GcvPA [Deltaproteobacteria bacterium]|nr:aminomethyl-transferring glycine dehydrogenase subunit GcvPA [Deltaproteobacteria bacterium]MBW2084712.1 aminomethyl-transferring glycine dehydrogenase subunit GcvPA [Deltaproteobacteria bacterium]
MRFLPHTDEDIASMLDLVGLSGLEDLFAMIPEDCRRPSDLSLPQPLTEWELQDLMMESSGLMAVRPEYKVFIGAGSYEHFIPASVTHLAGRSEFVTPYTPYQPEMSQGTLQAIYEYQTLVARLLGLEVANASLYDGASALAEAILMAVRITGRKKVALSSLVHPLYREVVQTYLKPVGHSVLELPYLENGLTDLSKLEGAENLAAVALQSPNFFGCIENLQTAGELAHQGGALFITCFTEPMAYGLLKNPGCQGADIACGEGQSFGIPESYGGPGLGIFTTKMKYVRNMPGRLVGRTSDAEGRQGFVLTLATREQHIRREKATSNICTNSSLCALTAAIYLASAGGAGLRELAELNHDKAEYLKRELKKAGCVISFESPTFNEFVVKYPDNFEAAHDGLLRKKIVPGLSLAPYFPELKGHYLLCVTETKSKTDMDALVGEVAS